MTLQGPNEQQSFTAIELLKQKKTFMQPFHSRTIEKGLPSNLLFINVRFSGENMCTLWVLCIDVRPVKFKHSVNKIIGFGKARNVPFSNACERGQKTLKI